MIDLDAAEKLANAANEEWAGDDSNECCGCSQTMYLASPELERVGLCGECGQKLADLVPALIAEVRRLRQFVSNASAMLESRSDRSARLEWARELRKSITKEQP